MNFPGAILQVCGKFLHGTDQNLRFNEVDEPTEFTWRSESVYFIKITMRHSTLHGELTKVMYR